MKNEQTCRSDPLAARDPAEFIPALGIPKRRALMEALLQCRRTDCRAGRCELISNAATKGASNMLKILGGTVGFIFLVGLLVILGLLALIF